MRPLRRSRKEPDRALETAPSMDSRPCPPHDNDTMNKRQSCSPQRTPLIQVKDPGRGVDHARIGAARLRSDAMQSVLRCRRDRYPNAQATWRVALLSADVAHRMDRADSATVRDRTVSRLGTSPGTKADSV